MKSYRFLKGRNHFQKGAIHELSDVVAEIYLKEGLVEPIETPINVVSKEMKTTIETKEEKFVKPMTTKRGRKTKS